MGRRGLRWATVLVPAAVLLGLAAPGPAVASCVGPQVWVQAGNAEPVGADGSALAVGPGDRLAVTGEWFRDGCADTGSGPGCSGPVGGGQVPMRDVALRLVTADRVWELATTDASGEEEDYAIAVEVTIPADAPPGAATLVVGPVELPVTLFDPAAAGP